MKTVTKGLLLAGILTGCTYAVPEAQSYTPTTTAPTYYYYPSAPVQVVPAPTYYAPAPQPVYIAPAPVYYAPPAYYAPGYGYPYAYSPVSLAFGFGFGGHGGGYGGGGHWR